MTDESAKLLKWIKTRGRVSRSQALSHGCPEYRRLRRLCLDELAQGGYIKRVNGWYVPADGSSTEGV